MPKNASCPLSQKSVIFATVCLTWLPTVWSKFSSSSSSSRSSCLQALRDQPLLQGKRITARPPLKTERVVVFSWPPPRCAAQQLHALTSKTWVRLGEQNVRR
ncbi:hypothetical protein Q8A73_000889 [Channa argus]|nr:hypothetical protein Q8A73_000889 [Channa argus]